MLLQNSWSRKIGPSLSVALGTTARAPEVRTTLKGESLQMHHFSTFSSKANKLITSHFSIHKSETVVAHCPPRIVEADFQSTVHSEALLVGGSSLQPHLSISTVSSWCGDGCTLRGAVTTRHCNARAYIDRPLQHLPVAHSQSRGNC